MSKVDHVTSLFRSCLGRAPTTAELRAYTSSRADARAMILETDEYRGRVHDRVAVLMARLAPEDGPPSRAETEAFVAQCRARAVDAHAAERRDVWEFMARRPDFRARVADELASRGHANDAGAVDFYVSKISADEGYFPDAFRRETARAEERAPLPLQPCAVSAEGARQALFVRAWRASTGSQIDIYEFLRYYHQFDGSPGEPGTLERVRKQVNESYYKTKTVNANYLRRDVSREWFTERYIMVHDKEGFVDALIDEIVGGQEYEAVMQEEIARQHRRLFDRALHEDDEQHVLQTLARDRATLVGDGVSTAVAHVVDELDRIRGAVQNVYRSVLKREPDEIEIRENVAGFRGGDAALAMERLSAGLFATLEYHEILREIIAAEFSDAHGRAPNRGEVYRALAIVLAECDDLRKCHGAVEAAVQSLAQA